MTNFASMSPEHLPGRHNMATDAFKALGQARANGEASKDSFSFSDLVDTLNPLQHIPVVATAYRELTGDEISPQARMAGGGLYGAATGLYGGAVGFAVSMVDSAVDMVSGSDIGGHLFAGLFGPDKPAEPVTTASQPSAAAITTASLAAETRPAKAPVPVPAKATKPVPSAIPQMSPETFDALLNSFADPKAAKAANADLAQSMANDVTGSTMAPSIMPPVVSAKTESQVKAVQGKSAMMQSMTSGLDQLDALKSANAKNLSMQAAASQANIGF